MKPDRPDFQELWEALFSFKSYAYELNLRQQLKGVDFEKQEDPLIEDFYEREKESLVMDGLHRLSHEVLQELSHISTVLAHPEEITHFWKATEEGLRLGVHALVDRLGEGDPSVARRSEALKASFEDYLVHHIRYMDAKTRFIHSATLD